jgi:hypothetical protein
LAGRTSAEAVNLGLIVTMHYRVVEDPGPRGPWKVSTAAYIYELTDEQEQRIVAYHSKRSTWIAIRPSP